MDNWFTIDKIDANTYIISEYRHWEETHCYLLDEIARSLLIDTGLGICNIYEEVLRLTDKPITVVATHIHWDHIGGHKYFPDFYAHAYELDWLNGKFPLSIETIREMIVDRCDLLEGFCVNEYELFQGMPTKVLTDHDIIDIGGTEIEVLHTPGHSQGICAFGKKAGDIYLQVIWYIKIFCLLIIRLLNRRHTMILWKKVAALPVKEVFPAHHSLDIEPEILIRMRETFRNLKADGKLHHVSGTFNYGDWGVWL